MMPFQHRLDAIYFLSCLVFSFSLPRQARFYFNHDSVFNFPTKSLLWWGTVGGKKSVYKEWSCNATELCNLGERRATAERDWNHLSAECLITSPRLTFSTSFWLSRFQCQID